MSKESLFDSFVKLKLILIFITLSIYTHRLESINHFLNLVYLSSSLAAVYARSGRMGEARDAMDEALRMVPDPMIGQSEATIRGMRAQIELALHGYDPGGVDGWIGPTTRSALTGFQRDQGLPQSGGYDDATLERLGVSTSPLRAP